MDIGREMRVIDVVEDTNTEVEEAPVPVAGFDARKPTPLPKQ